MTLTHFFSVKKFVFLLTASGILSFSASVYPQNTWEQTRKESGVKVFERETDSRLNDLKTVFKLNSGVMPAISFLLDEDAFKSMVSNIEEARMIKKVSDTLRYYYLRVSVENIINRDAVVKVLFQQDSRSGLVTCIMKLDNSIGYEMENQSIMPFTAHWYLRPTRWGKVNVKMIYKGQIDEYNELVYNMVEEIMKSQLFKVSKRMKSKVSSNKYKHTQINIFH